jgi:hypothetical protein
MAAACSAQKLITTDIDNFWRAYDASQPGDRAAAFQKLYLEPGSPGLKDFLKLRITSAEELAKTVDATPKFYATIRPSTLAVASQKEAILAHLKRFKELYPEASFPNVYFVIGRLTTGGTTGNSGLLIGTEVYSLADTVDSSEIQQSNPAFLKAMGSIGKLPLIVVHELVHSQQKHKGKTMLLSQSLIEGAADFVTQLVASSTINAYANEWASARRDELFRKFAHDVAETPNIWNGWMYNFSCVQGDEPADLGYWIGAEICRAYYEAAESKPAALRDIVRMEQPESIVRGSSYAWVLPPAK